MGIIVPSYLLKLDRARAHLSELEDELRKYTESTPYLVRESNESGHVVRRIVFTSQPDLRAGPIAGDVVYNVRSALDHLAAELNPPSVRRDVMFPIFWEGVWADSGADESAQLARDRSRWATSTRHMQPEAVEILMALQPPMESDTPGDSVNNLVALNRLSNQDRHSRLPLVSVGLRIARCTYRDVVGGDQRTLIDTRDFVLDDGGKLNVPEHALDVGVEGVPEVSIRVGEPSLDVAVPGFFDRLLHYVSTGIIDPLTPFLHV
jgi:hypothetical protein